MPNISAIWLGDVAFAATINQVGANVRTAIKIAYAPPPIIMIKLYKLLNLITKLV